MPLPISEPPSGDHSYPGEFEGPDMLEIGTALALHWRKLILTPVITGAAALGCTFLISPTFTARTVFLPPQQQQSATASALASLGSLAGIAGGAAGAIKTPGDQYLALLSSVNVGDRIIDRFKLMDEYKTEYRASARKRLEQDVRISLGKKDGLIAIEVDSGSPQMAADIANQFVAELRRLSSDLALTEAQQRRVFFEGELQRAKVKLTEAQLALQRSGFTEGALKAEPKAAAETFALLRAELTAAEVKLRTLSHVMAEGSPELQTQSAKVGALRAQVQRLESSSSSTNDANYIGRYREFKYQEALFEQFARQYEIARVDESREGALLQVVDIATPPELKSKPRRLAIAASIGAGTFVLFVIAILTRHLWRRTTTDPRNAERYSRFRLALRR
ncbi:Wzz/FepE/Etk N-terminal domain-containing protein [Pelomonas sp. Root1444]|uniref:Wzz/FepE/Etk N-terminal domain-containing protein n=1 Tax=Pelomonas sp. Root1444 TaxID=1736464 RepID=UPI001F309C50|nr:Wzz/FepE/Etk N-terminal domain-containing protein [Pelomonas sp. Root1444]